MFNAFLARILPKHAGIQQYITNHGRVFKSKGWKESNTGLYVQVTQDTVILKHGV